MDTETECLKAKSPKSLLERNRISADKAKLTEEQTKDAPGRPVRERDRFRAKS